ncbi:DUF3592 domain-containing protein [Herbiconiux sp. VKM Ac-2851]|jgi:hypothetical protein|uniref:DUF3592 domain-containing protein n=1 Tax=Herbiconiux sp. VKM Ac-2851 TaxID=2739025 RepID=UPI0015652D72|nr:DUF3592 domain-containing protein [Herbiconiux sp. VKM Ac-2851]NQX36487.1 hypothetical protein [Herbiconiux sp. VKM Ac-2851]
MDDPVDALSLITELFSWIGIGLGVLLLVVGYVRGAFFRNWPETLGVVVLDDTGQLVYRWMGEDGVLYEAPCSDDHGHSPEPGDDVTVHVNPRDPAVGRIDDPSHEGRAFRTTGWILLGIGVAAVVLQFVLLIVSSTAA